MTWTPITITPPAGDAASIDSQSGDSVQKRLVHPWMTGIGEGAGHYRHLSFPNAVKALSDTLSNEQAALGIAVSAANLTDFADQIDTLSASFPVRELTAMATKAKALLPLEIEKFNLPKTAGAIADKAMHLAGLGAIADLRKSALMEQAVAAATAFEATSPITNLTNYVATKTADDAAVAAALANSKAKLTGGAGWRFYAESDIANAILQNTPDHQYTHTAIILFTGAPADLALLKEIVA